ncbi:Pentapeptide repeat-containing protein [Selenomonas sp. GACV-9]|uniref:pentapeptide repeat-containing protein n=1 Tax=Selenomonas sp. GACV-9 TaxID=3158782 RepID=UPI0008E26004|nr:Pentapeptide repeat-containing protein [Selenomonas ruminantium]
MFSSLDEYKQEYYADRERGLLQKLNMWLGDSKAERRQEWLRAMTDILQQAIAVQQQAQQAGQSLSCRYLTCSLLYISIYQGQPVIRVEFFGDADSYPHAPWLTAAIDVKGLLTLWTPFEQQVLDKQRWLARYYAPAEIRRLFPQTIEKMVYLLACHWRYWVRELLLQGAMTGLAKSEGFALTLGQYRGWQEPVYTAKPPQDLLLHGARSLAGVDFVKGIYRGQTIRQDDWSETRFWDCCWERVQLEQVNLADALFVNCRFYGVAFTDCCLAGARFVSCAFYTCTFTACDANPESQALPATRLYQGACWQACKWQHCVFDRCDLQRMRVSDDWQENVTLRDCKTGQAGFMQIEQEADDD